MFFQGLGPASTQRVVSASWIVVWLDLMYHCCSGLEVSFCLYVYSQSIARMVLAPWQNLHNNCTSSGPRLRYDDKGGIHVRGQVDSVVACGQGRLGKASRGEREST
jgi:hypothetical protein